MVMKVLRDTASGGIGKFILFGFLVLAVAGLALMDIGGFFRTGTGSNNVIKIDVKTVPITDFDREVRRQLAPVGIAPKDAYKMGYMNQIIAGEIRKVLLNNLATDTGIAIDQPRVAAHIAKLIKPLSTDGQRPEDILRQILRNQGLTEKQFEDAIRDEMKNTLITDAVAAGAAKINPSIIDGLYQFQNESRDIEYLKFHDTEMDIETPDDATLQHYYDTLRETYKIPETREIQVFLLDDSDLKKDTSLDAVAILDEKYARVEKLEDLAASGLSAEDIASEVAIKTYTIPQIGTSGQLLGDEIKLPKLITQNLPQIAEEAFALDIGQTSMALKFDGAQFAAVRVNAMQPQDYHPFEKVKTQLIERWKKEQQHTLTLQRAEDVKRQLEEEGISFETYADTQKRNYRTAKGLQRGKALAPFPKGAVNMTFTAQPGTYLITQIEGGATIINVTNVNIPQVTDTVRQSSAYKTLHSAIKDSASEEALATILEDMHSKTPALINYDLLDRIYGDNSEFY